MIPRQKRNVLMLFILLWSVGVIFAAVLSQLLLCNIPSSTLTCEPDFVKGNGWKLIYIIQSVIGLFAAILRFLLVNFIESPTYLISKRKDKEAVRMFKLLASKNGDNINFEILDKLCMEKHDFGCRENDQQFNFKQLEWNCLYHLFKTESNSYNTIEVWLSWCTISISFSLFYGFTSQFILSMMLNSLLSQNETYLNIYINSVVGLIGSLTGYILLMFVNAEHLLFFSCISACLSLFLFITSSLAIFQTVFHSILSFFSILMYVSDYFIILDF
jgi:hypothetical protein